MIDSFVFKDGKQLRRGYTTGTCAAAAAKASAWMLLSSQEMKSVHLVTPSGMELELPVLNICRNESQVSCAIQKDSGDDPDITDGALIYAAVSLIPEPEIKIDGGIGVGRVTKKGLDQPVGTAAINSVPRQMIRENLEEVCRVMDYHKGLSVIISVPDGEKLAQKTFNSRLGIEGGISILGTSGIVEPMSDQALIDTIRLELQQRKSNGADRILLTPGNYGMNFLKKNIAIDSQLPVMTSNFIGEALDCCTNLGFKEVLLVGHIGKLVKIAGGMLNTHSRYGDCRMEIITAHAAAVGLKSEKAVEILNGATCDDALRILDEEGLQDAVLERLISKISENLNRRTNGNPIVGVMIFSNVYGKLAETENAAAILSRIQEEG